MLISLNVDIIFKWEAKVNRSQEEFDNISKAIKKELERFELQRVKDFKAAFISYLEAQMKSQDKVSSFVVYRRVIDRNKPKRSRGLDITIIDFRVLPSDHRTLGDIHARGQSYRLRRLLR